MEIHIHIHHHGDNDVISKLISINQKLNNMPTKSEFEQAFVEINESTNNIAADIVRLTEQLQTGNLTEAEETEVFSQLRGVADRLKAIADTTPEQTEPPQA